MIGGIFANPWDLPFIGSGKPSGNSQTVPKEYFDRKINGLLDVISHCKEVIEKVAPGRWIDVNDCLPFEDKGLEEDVLCKFFYQNYDIVYSTKVGQMTEPSPENGNYIVEWKKIRKR